jgi:steroid delta-isomerase-like uncharacterized protein
MLDALVKAWNARNGEAVAMSYMPTGVRWEYALPGARLEGRDAIAGHVQAYMDAFPDCALVVRGVGETPDGRFVLEWTFRGTHQNDLPGLPAQGEEIALDGVSVCEMDGPLIRVERVYWDAATLLAGAGVLG